MGFREYFLEQADFADSAYDSANLQPHAST
jgi:hypothetical protein